MVPSGPALCQALGDPYPEGAQSSVVGSVHGSATTPQWAFQCLDGWGLESTENFPAERRGNTHSQQRVPLRPASKVAAIKGALTSHRGQPPLLVPRRGTGAHGTSSPHLPPTSRAPQLCPGHPAAGRAILATQWASRSWMAAHSVLPGWLNTGAAETHWPLVRGSKACPRLNQSG